MKCKCKHTNLEHTSYKVRNMPFGCGFCDCLDFEKQQLSQEDLIKSIINLVKYGVLKGKQATNLIKKCKAVA